MHNLQITYEKLLETIQEGIWVIDADSNTTFVNPKMAEILGYEAEEMIGRHLFEFLDEEEIQDIERKVESRKSGIVESHESRLKHKDGHVVYVEIKSNPITDDEGNYNGAIATGNNDRVEYRIKKKDGSYNWVETIGNIIFADDKVIGAIFTVRDISNRKQAEYELQEQKNLLNSMFQSIQDGISILNADLTIREVNHTMEKWFAHKGSFIGKKCYEVYHDRSEPCELCPSIKALEKKTVCSEIVPLMGEGTQVGWIELYAYPLIDETSGNINGVVEFARDISERKQAEEKIRYMSYHDQLTELYNRNYFEYIKEELKEIPLVSVIMTDVNGLKLINDTYGHGVGDELLKEYAELLINSFKQSDLCFRWGGDEFVVILKNTGEAESWELCNRLIKHCGKTFIKDIPLSVSVGISSKFRGKDVVKAIKEAEDMMYKNKLKASKSNKSVIMKTLLMTLSEKSFETKEHIKRMSLLARHFGERLCLPPSELSRLDTLAMLHDVGNINIDGHILLKETALSDEEWEEIKKHPEVGYRITRTTEEFAYIAEEILHHHERWDGNGYPQGLEGENIPYLARVLNIIDSYDVKSNGRPYKRKMTRKEIIEEIKRCSGKQFDPVLAEEFILFLKDGDFDIAKE